jgi:hypothetical protein
MLAPLLRALMPQEIESLRQELRESMDESGNILVKFEDRLKRPHSCRKASTFFTDRLPGMP